MKKKKKIIDCRWFPTDDTCTLTISDPEKEILKIATDHVIRFHDEKNMRKVREKLRHLLKDAHR